MLWLAIAAAVTATLNLTRAERGWPQGSRLGARSEAMLFRVQ